MADIHYDKVELLLPLNEISTASKDVITGGLQLADPLWPFTRRLLHMDGAPGSQTLVDARGASITVNAAAMQLKDSNYKFGGSSLWNDGTICSATWVEPTPIGTSDFCIEAWVFPTGWDREWTIYSGTKITGGGYGPWLMLDKASQRLQMHLYDGTNMPIWLVTTTGSIQLNNWYHVAAVRQGTSGRLYINGELKGSCTFPSVYDLSSTDVMLGSTYAPDAFRGYIDELRVTVGHYRYSSNFSVPTKQFPTTDSVVPVTTTTVQFDSAHDYSKNAAECQVTGCTVATTNTLYSGAYSFDGLGSFVELPSDLVISTTDDFCIEVFVRVPDVTGVKPVYGNSQYLFGIVINGSAVKVIHDGVDLIVSNSGTILSDTWAHIAVARDNGVTRLFVNGVVRGTSASAISVAYPSGFEPRLGNIDLDYFKGYMTDFRITVGESRYQTNFTLKDERLVKQIAGTVAYDAPSIDQFTYASRTVRAHTRLVGNATATAVSNGNTGAFTLTVPDVEHYVIALDDDAGYQYNAIVFDRISPV